MTQKASHAFHMESLNEDNKCLMDMVDEMKADIAATKSENTDLQAKKAALTHELEQTKNKLEEEKEEGRKRSEMASPSRLLVLEQVRHFLSLSSFLILFILW